MFRVISYFELHLDEKNRDSAKSFEEVLDAALRTNATADSSHWVIPQHESELFNKVVENLLVVVNFRGRERIRLSTPERRTSISPLLSDAQEGCRTAST
jgi:hypothetical protein